MTTLELFNISPITYCWMPEYDPFEPVNKPGKIIHKEVVIHAILAHYEIDEKDVTSKNRKRETVIARQVCMYMLKKYTLLSLKNIGLLFGGRDHTTAIHSINTVKNLLVTSDKMRADLIRITKTLEGDGILALEIMLRDPMNIKRFNWGKQPAKPVIKAVVKAKPVEPEQKVVKMPVHIPTRQERAEMAVYSNKKSLYN